MTHREHKVRALKVLAMMLVANDVPDALTANDGMSDEDINKACDAWRELCQAAVERVRKTVGNEQWRTADGYEASAKVDANNP